MDKLTKEILSEFEDEFIWGLQIKSENISEVFVKKLFDFLFKSIVKTYEKAFKAGAEEGRKKGIELCEEIVKTDIRDKVMAGFPDDPEIFDTYKNMKGLKDGGK